MSPAVASIVLAIAGALAFVAYRHPESYKKISNKIIFMCFAICILLITYDIGAEVMDKTLLPFLDAAKAQEATAARDSVRLDKGIMVLGVIIVIFYVMALDALKSLGIVSEKYTEEQKALEISEAEKRRRTDEQAYQRISLERQIEALRQERERPATPKPP